MGFKSFPAQLAAWIVFALVIIGIAIAGGYKFDEWVTAGNTKTYRALFGGWVKQTKNPDKLTFDEWHALWNAGELKSYEED